MKAKALASRTREAKVVLPRKRDAAEWRRTVWELPDDLVSLPQKLQLMLMLGAKFNAFDPFTVVRDLLKHRSLWHGALMGRGYTVVEGTHTDLCRLSSDLVHLRDLGAGVWNVDTIFLLTDAGAAPRWEPIVGGWGASDVNVLDAAESGQLLGGFGPVGQLEVITVWWE